MTGPIPTSIMTKWWLELSRADLEQILRPPLTELEITEALLADDRQRVLDAIPPCPLHGAACVPHALEWIERAKLVMTQTQANTGNG